MEQQTKLPKVRENKERNGKGKQMETDKRRDRDGERKNGTCGGPYPLT